MKDALRFLAIARASLAMGLLLLTPSALRAEDSSKASAKNSFFSVHAVSLFDLLEPRQNSRGFILKTVEVVSPNGKRKLVFPMQLTENDKFEFYAVHDGNKTPIPIGVFVNPYAMWNDESSSAFVTYSDSGAAGGYHAILLNFENGNVYISEPTKQVESAFDRRFIKLGLSCMGGEKTIKEFGIRLNFGPIKFIDKNHALIAAEVVGPWCDCGWAFHAYEVELPSGKIVGEHDQAETKL